MLTRPRMSDIRVSPGRHSVTPRQQPAEKPPGHQRLKFTLKLLAVILITTATGLMAFAALSIFTASNRYFTIDSFTLTTPPPAASFRSAVTAAASTVEVALNNKITPLTGEKNNRVNILFLGMAGQPNPAPYLTDTILVISVQPSSGKVALISIPRDLFVASPFPNKGVKINSLFEYGKLRSASDPQKLIIAKVQDIIGEPVDYWVTVDLSVVKAVVDAIGGIDVYVTKPIYDPQFPGPNYTYETFQMSAGFHHLDGATTAKFVRMRHSSGGDFDRVERQRQVVEAVVRKLRDLNLFWNFPQLLHIYQNLQGHVATNITTDEGRRLYQLLKNTDGKQVYDTSLSDDPTSGTLVDSKSLYGADILLPKVGFENYSQIKPIFEGIFNHF